MHKYVVINGDIIELEPHMCYGFYRGFADVLFEESEVFDSKLEALETVKKKIEKQLENARLCT
ncbi:MAG: hypothetical protein ACFFG0_15580 [Candidatus Thorarchaeota archaeon]